MKRWFLSLACVVAAFAACNSNGEIYMVNDKSEIYYEGEGVTSDDAKRLGDFLLKNNYFDTLNKKTVQLTSTNDTFNLKFVVDEEKVKKDRGADMLFSAMGASISTSVFNGKPVKVILADQKLNAFKEMEVVQGGGNMAPELPATTETTPPADSLNR